MKRIAAFIIVMLLCFAIPVISYADDIYYVEDEEEAFVPETTTQKEAETTTSILNSGGLEGILGGNLGEYFDDFTGILGEGFESIYSGLKDDFGNLQIGVTESTTESALQPISPDNEMSAVSQMFTTLPDEQATTVQNAETTAQVNVEELPSVLIVNNGKDSDDSLSGGTLTLLMFIVGIIVLILVGAIVLVFMTRKTDYNSKVKIRSAIPAVAQPDALAQFMENDTISDDKDYSNISYWDK